MNRYILDKLALDHHLSEPAIDLALQLTGGRPDQQAWMTFFVRLLRAAGIGALSAGTIFFVAANWQDYGVMGRFVILQTAFFACVGIACWRPPPSMTGQAATILATLLIGALLALFGQSYQTGADIYELFFAWATLALPFALAGRSAVLWAVWWVVLNVALGLYAGWMGREHVIWLLLDRWGINKPLLLMLPCAVNLAGAGLFLPLSRSRFAYVAPQWLVRMLAAFGFFYGTLACITAVATTGWWSSRSAAMTGQNLFVAAVFVGTSVAIMLGALRSKKDVFPIALTAGSWIAISSALLIDRMRLNDLGGLFVVAMWLIVTSTIAGWILMKCVRAWNVDERAHEMPA